MGATNGKPAKKDSIRNLLFKQKDNEAARQKTASKLSEDFPHVAAILGGLPAEGDEEAVPSGSITIFIHEDGKARFSIKVKAMQQSFSGDMDDILNPWGAINTALGMGEVSSKRYTGQGTSGSPADIAF